MLFKSIRVSYRALNVFWNRIFGVLYKVKKNKGHQLEAFDAPLLPQPTFLMYGLHMNSIEKLYRAFTEIA